MKRKKRIISILILTLALVCITAFGLTACREKTVYVTSIEKTGVNGNVDVYTIYYSNGTTSTLEITNGKNGNDLTAEDLYNEYVERYGEISYADFLAMYLNYSVNDYSIINRCLQSSAKVYTEFLEYGSGSGYLGSSSRETAVYSGSAVIYRIDSDYTYFITNYHVVYDSDAINSKVSESIYVYLYGSEGTPVKSGTGSYGNDIYDYGKSAISCEYVGGSVNYDIALLRARTSIVKSVNPNVCAAEFANNYCVGETAIAIGNPEDLGISVTKGIVSIDNDFIVLNIDGTDRSYRSIRIDTSIYNGSSGGGLFNLNGKLIGITNAGQVTEQNINYAVPLQIVKNTVENIMHYNTDGNSNTNGVYKITIGITVTAQNSRFVYDETLGYGQIYEDVLVTLVNDNSIASGLKLSANDLITALYINGERYDVTRYYDIGDHLLKIFANDIISFEYLRNGKTLTTANYTVKVSDLKVG